MKYDNHTFDNMEHRIGGPGYRWKRAKQHAGLQRPSWSQHLDEPTRQATAYLRMHDRVGEEPAEREFPLIAAACALFQNEQDFQTVRLCVLGELPTAEIAARFGVYQEVIEIAKTLFFDIRDVRNASSWMSNHVFMPEVKGGSMDFAAKMKLAFYGGPVMVRGLLDAEENLPLEEAQRFVDQETLLHGKLQAALGFELDANTAPEFVKLFSEYNLERAKLDFEREKFQYTCELAREKRKGNEVQGDVESKGEVPSEEPADGDADEEPAAA